MLKYRKLPLIISSPTTSLISERGGGGVLRISSEGDDRIGAKIKTQKNSVGLPAKPNLVKLGQLYIVFLLLPWPPFSPCPIASYIIMMIKQIKLSLTVKTDNVKSGRRDVDLHRRLREVQERMG